jgi:hypothetical protein
MSDTNTPASSEAHRERDDNPFVTECRTAGCRRYRLNDYLYCAPCDAARQQALGEAADEAEAMVQRWRDIAPMALRTPIKDGEAHAARLREKGASK